MRGLRGMRVDLKGFHRAMLEQAARLYLAEAYGDAPLPAAVRERLQWPPGETLEDLAAGPPFERTPADAPLRACQRIRLRLGNRNYPHMKLGVDRIPDTDAWVLVADCHDKKLVTVVQESERGALESLMKYNADAKTRIERRWAEAGLPTFENYVRTRLAQDRGGTRSGA